MALPGTSDSDASRTRPSWLRDGQVLVHIGVHKTGTTSVQGAMAIAREDLLSQGVLYPGQKGPSHYGAARAVVGRRSGWDHGGWIPPMSRWEQLMDEVHAAPGKVMLSGEVLCEAGTSAVRRIIDDIGHGRARILITLRPLEQIIPSTWQQYIKAGSYFGYEEWLRDMMRGPDEARETPSFWKRNDHGALVERWADVAGNENVAVLVVDTSDPRGIFDGFEDIIGLRRGTLAPTPGSNRSLSANEVELVRQLNEAVRENIEYRTYNRIVRQGGIAGLVEGRRPGEDEETLLVPGWAAEQARDYGRTSVRRIRDAGVEVFGDLDELVPRTPLETDVLRVPSAVPIEAPAVMLHSLLERAVQEFDAERAAQEALSSKISELKLQLKAERAAQEALTSKTSELKLQLKAEREAAAAALRLTELRTPRGFAGRVVNKLKREARKLRHRLEL